MDTDAGGRVGVSGRTYGNPLLMASVSSGKWAQSHQLELSEGGYVKDWKRRKRK